jgi:uncharacterized protein (DUF342 family)
MEKSNLYNDNMIGKIEDLVDDVEEFAKTVNEEIDDKDKIEIKLKQLRAIQGNIGIKDDGYVEMRISKDEMNVFADFYPPIGGGNPISHEYVKSLLRKKNINYGVDWDKIKEMISLCNNKQNQENDVLIAKGESAINEIPPHYVIEESLMQKTQITESNDNQIDFKKQSAFTLVKKGHVLARKIPTIKGQIGFNVFGRAIPYRTKVSPPLRSGKNVHTEDDKFIASCDGRFQYKGTIFWVDEILVVNTDVDYKTGNINFQGDVIIKGMVKDGFKINAGRSVYCQDTLDASEVYCKGNLIVRNGIIGRKKGIVKVSGNIKAKFIENCYVEAKGSIEVRASIVNSLVNTLDKISLGDRGIIIGGQILTQNGLIAKQIGSDSAQKTEIYCGIDFVVQNKLKWIKDKNYKLLTRFNEIQNRIARMREKDSKLSELRDSIKNAIDKLNEAAKLLIGHLDKNEDAKIIVKGIIYRGTYIEICHVKYIVPQTLPRVMFTLNRRKGRIETKTF